MFGYSDKTLNWIIGYFLFNLSVVFYLYIFFHDHWIQSLVSLTIPLFVWEILTFGILVPDDVFMEVFGENHSSDAAPPSQVPSVRAVIVSSGDH